MPGPAVRRWLQVAVVLVVAVAATGRTDARRNPGSDARPGEVIVARLRWGSGGGGSRFGFGAAWNHDYPRAEQHLSRIARELNVPLVPFVLEGVGGDARLNQPDGIHPTAEGHQVLTRNVLPHLRPLIQKRSEKKRSANVWAAN